jgi:hypothetical protein
VSTGEHAEVFVTGCGLTCQPQGNVDERTNFDLS